MSTLLTRRKVLTKTIAAGAALVAGRTISAAVLPGESKKNHHVIIRELEYFPTKLEVSVGDRIVWTNMDFAPHTVTANDDSWDSKLMKQNETWHLDVIEETQTEYYCRYHPTMKAKITIK